MVRSAFAVILGFTLATSAAAQTLSERAREARQTPNTPVVVTMASDMVRLSLEDLTKQSDLVVEATVSRLKTYVNEADTAVITDLAVHPIRVFKGDLPSPPKTPGAATPFVLSVYGGQLVRDGITLRAEDLKCKTPKDGVSYLLFLQTFGNVPGRFRIYNCGAFEISNDRLRLSVIADSGSYQDFVKGAYADVVHRVKATAGTK